MSGQGQTAKRRGLVMRMDDNGIRPLQLMKAAGICTPLGMWLCLHLVWQQDLSLSSEKPLGYTGATACREAEKSR